MEEVLISLTLNTDAVATEISKLRIEKTKLVETDDDWIEYEKLKSKLYALSDARMFLERAVTEIISQMDK